MSEVKTPNIVWTRIDERLLHGQIRITWGKQSNANLILVANDNAAEGPSAAFMQAAMKSSAGGEYAVRFFTLQKTIEVIHKASPKQAILILVDKPADLVTLVEGGVPIKHINIGNMHFHDGKTQLTRNVSVDEADIAAFRRLAELGVQLEVQHMPDSTPVQFFDLYKG